MLSAMPYHCSTKAERPGQLLISGLATAACFYPLAPWFAMTDTFRALCARMADELDRYRQLLMDDRRETHALAAEARAALAEPEPQGPSDEDLLGLDDLRDAWNAQADAVNSWDELGIDEIIWFAQRQALARWGRPLPTDTTP